MVRLINVCRTCRDILAAVGVNFVALALAEATTIGLCFGADVPTAAESPPLQFNAQVAAGDWSQLGGTPSRNNTPDGVNIPTDWDIETRRNVKWNARLGSQTFGNIVVANGKIYVGTNNASGYLKRYPSKVDLGVLLCFRESDGEFLWQHSSEKLPANRANGQGCCPNIVRDLDSRSNVPALQVQDLSGLGVCSAPVVEADRLWFVTNRGEIVCLDTESFLDGENDGPFVSEKPDKADVAWDEQHEADVVWSFDMMKELGMRPHYTANCSPTIWGDVLFVCTSNGADETLSNIPAPDAPSFLAINKHTGKVLWTDNSPGKYILNGQWSSPAIGVFDGVPQVLFPGGDGWLYSMRADRWNEGKPELLWKFDGNPKDAIYGHHRRARKGEKPATRNENLSTPVIDGGLVYVSMGDASCMDGPGHLWCIDATKRGDVSPEIVVDQNGNVVPNQQIQATGAIQPDHGRESEKNVLNPLADADQPGVPSIIPNPNSAVVWHYDKHDQNGNGKIEFEETMHRTHGGPAIKNNLLFIADASGLVHCLNARTGTPHWTCDVLSHCWASPLIVVDSVFVGDEDGDVAIFSLSADPLKSVKKAESKSGVSHEPLVEIKMESVIYTTPVVANNVLYITVGNELFAITSRGNGQRRLPPKTTE